MLMNCGDARQIRPARSWVTYGLGWRTELPGFIAMCPAAFQSRRRRTGQSAFLPGLQALHNTQNTALDRLIENIRNTAVTADQQRSSSISCSAQPAPSAMARRRPAARSPHSVTFQLAYGMQHDAEMRSTSARAALDRDMYGSGVHAGSC